MTHSPAFSHAVHQDHVFALRFEWLMGLSVFLMIEQYES